MTHVGEKQHQFILRKVNPFSAAETHGTVASVKRELFFQM